MRKIKIKLLNKISQKSRIYGLMSIFFAGSGHPGGVLSCMEIIVYLFVSELKIKKLSDFKRINRSRFILSKGHSVPAVYSTLAAVGAINYKKHKEFI